MKSCNSVTKVAITTMNAGMRTLSGMTFFMTDITMLERIRTNIVASPMLMPFIDDVVVPNVGHMPKRSANVGFSLTKPFVNTCKLVISYLI